MALGALPALTAVSTAPAKAESVPAGFDCAKTAGTEGKFICSQAVLRWQDLALSRAYAAAKVEAVGSVRDALVLRQRDWIPATPAATNP
ncbi:hypothetical protein [Bosea sp. (in: a-proteobacteria)]